MGGLHQAYPLLLTAVFLTPEYRFLADVCSAIVLAAIWTTPIQSPYEPMGPVVAIPIAARAQLSAACAVCGRGPTLGL